jgi:hypothetical protein
MIRLIDLWLSRVFAPVFEMLRDVPDQALPRLFMPF